MSQKSKPVSLSTATLLIVANSIGTGIFTTTGFALDDLKNPWAVLAVWVLGAMYSVLGVFCYQELHRLYPGSGGEYHFLSEGFHRGVGKLAGWVTLVAGFSAPIATSVMAFALYGARVITWPVPPVVVGSVLIVIVTAFHSAGFSKVFKIHDGFVWGKLIGFLLLILAAFLWNSWSIPEPQNFPSPSRMAYSFFWIVFSFSGWNAVYYIANEISGSSKNVSFAAIIGTLGVCVVYLSLNIAMLFSVHTAELAGQPEVVGVFLNKLFGQTSERWLSFLIAFGLISTTSALFMTGPRVYARMAQDGALPKIFSVGDGKIPRASIFLQGGVSLLILWSLQFDKIISTTGFVLALCSALSVSILLKKAPKGRVIFYSALLFCLITLWLAYAAMPRFIPLF